MENLEIGAYSLRHRRQLCRERIDEALTSTPLLKDRAGDPAGSLSGGQQQQLALAKALLVRPRLLCIDELSLGLAPSVVLSLLTTLRDINAQGTTLVLVEQSLDVAADICERAIFLEKGEVSFEGPPAELLERGDIARSVFVRDRGQGAAV
jgi:branched-chain amino acid transport system ATP-binding protein